MCGIAGIVAEGDNSRAHAAVVQRMCQKIIHRGPDDEGIYAKGGVGLGMRRLSIIDLSGGRQPIHNEDGTVWIVFNGEIYNFPTLRCQLEKRGHRFYTQSDTEVIVHLYEDLGAECVQKLRGMFAFALYDERRRSLLLARDRLGKKPLHYALDQGALLFGSEIKSLLAVAPELAKIHPDALLEFFYFGYIPDPHTAFRSIAKLPPGHILEFQGGAVRVRRYWDIPAYGTHEAASEQACLEELEEKLAEAVRIRLISEVPLGALLSGGVDSSIIVALMARASSRPVKTFSIGFADQDFNEAPYARAVAERFATEHHELIVQPDVGRTLEQLTSAQEEPFGDSSMLPTYHVSRIARQHVTVALSGDGGDELFAGYDRYPIHLRRDKFNGLPTPMGKFFRDRIYPCLWSSVPGRRFAFALSLSSRDRYLDSISHLPVLGREASLFSNEFLSWVGECESPLRTFQEYFDGVQAPDTLSRLLYLDTKTYLAADVLTKVDRMSMATSLEVRCPILDHEIVEWAARLPSHWKLRQGSGKYILKKLAERIGIPKQVLHRPKQGFAVPLTHWLRRELKDDLLQLLLEPKTVQRGYFKLPAVRKLIDEHLRGRRDRSYDLWLMLVLELWHRNFLEAQLGLSACPPLRDTSHWTSRSRAAKERDVGSERPSCPTQC